MHFIRSVMIFTNVLVIEIPVSKYIIQYASSIADFCNVLNQKSLIWKKHGCFYRAIKGEIFKSWISFTTHI
jgi:hypothetical protein